MGKIKYYFRIDQLLVISSFVAIFLIDKLILTFVEGDGSSPTEAPTGAPPTTGNYSFCHGINSYNICISSNTYSCITKWR